MAMDPAVLALGIEAAVRGAASSGHRHAASTAASALRTASELILPYSECRKGSPYLDAEKEDIKSELRLRQQLAAPALAAAIKAGRDGTSTRASGTCRAKRNLGMHW